MNLTTLANVKTWIPQMSGTTTSDTLITQLIQRCSSQILAYLQRPDINEATYTDYFDGVPNYERLMLRNWPVLSVSQVKFYNQVIPQSSSPGQAGWSIETWDGSVPGVPQRIGITGYDNCWGGVGFDSGGQLVSYRGGNNANQRGFQNVSVTYSAGYVVNGEKQNIPATPGPYTVTPNQPYGIWSADEGVTYANGNPLIAVASNPTAGQYVPPAPWAASPTTSYTFASGDQGASIILSYSFIPFALEQGAIEWVSERFRYTQRIGIKSQSLSGQETVSYQLGMPDVVKMMIDPYAKSFPL